MSGLKSPAHLNLEGNIAINWSELHATAAGVKTKSEKVQCTVSLHLAGPDTPEVAHTLDIKSTDRDKFTPSIDAFRNCCERKDNMTVVHYSHTSESVETYIRELRYKIAHCKCGVLEDSLLRDRLVCGMKGNKLRSRLQQTPGLTLTKCIQMCWLNEHV